MKESTLKDLTLNITDGKHGDCEGQDNSGYYFISCKDVHDGQIYYEGARQITEKDYIDTHKRTQLEPNDILITNSGTIGRMAFIKETPLVYRTTFQKSVAIVKPNPDLIYPLYLYYQLQNCVAQFINSSNGSAQKNLLLSTMRAFKIKYHSDFSIQHRIASILSAYDDLIENNQKQIKLLEEAAQRLYKEWFVDLRFPNYENTPVVDGVPEGWEKKTILDMSAVLRRGISPKYNESGKYTVINQKCIRQTIMDIKESRKQEKEYASDMNLKDSDIVICSTGSGTLGRVGQVFGDYPDTSFDSHVTLIRAKNAINVQFLFWALKNLQPLLMTLGQGSTNQLELPKRVIESYEIICPTDELIKDFQFIVQPIHDKITSLVEIIKNATEARDRLLPKLMSGELEV